MNKYVLPSFTLELGLGSCSYIHSKNTAKLLGDEDHTCPGSAGSQLSPTRVSIEKKEVECYYRTRRDYGLAHTCHDLGRMELVHCGQDKAGQAPKAPVNHAPIDESLGKSTLSYFSP